MGTVRLETHTTLKESIMATKEFMIDSLTKAVPSGSVTWNGIRGRMWAKWSYYRGCWVFQCQTFFKDRTPRRDIADYL